MDECGDSESGNGVFPPIFHNWGPRWKEAGNWDKALMIGSVPFQLGFVVVLAVMLVIAFPFKLIRSLFDDC